VAEEQGVAPAGHRRLERAGARSRLLTRLVLIGMALLLAAYVAPLFL